MPQIKLLSGGGSGKRGFGGSGGGGGSAWLGTLNCVVKSGVATLADSQIYDDGTNVGIGVTPATSKLHVRGSLSNTIRATIQNTTVTAGAYPALQLVSGTSANAGFRLYSQNTVPLGGIYPSGLYIYNSIASGPISIWAEGATGNIYCGTNNTLRMTIDYSGIVDIYNLVQISMTGLPYSLRINRTDAGASYVVFSNNLVDKIWLQRESVTHDFTIGVGVESLRCQQTTGYVGINKTVPSVRLDVNDVAAPDTIVARFGPTNQASVTGDLVAIELNTGGDPVDGYATAIAAICENHLSGIRLTGMAFYTSQFGGRFTEKMRIKSDGNVGIGTITPGYLATAGEQKILTISGDSGGLVYNQAGAGLELNMTNSLSDTVAGSIAFTASAFAMSNKCLAMITAESQGTIGDPNCGGLLKIYVKEWGSSVLLDAVWIRQNGQVVINYGARIENGLLVNDNGIDADTRIEGENDAYLTCWDASADAVGFGTDSPNGKVEIYVQKTSRPLSLVLTTLDLNHGVTTLLPTTGFGGILCGSPDGLSEGGLLIRGISTNPDVSYVNGIRLHGVTSPGEGTPSAIDINGSHKSGTGVVVVPDGSMILSISNNATVKSYFYGDGALRLGGTLYVDHIYNNTNLHPITFDYLVNLSTCPIYANNAAALAGGLVAGDLYRTNADPDPVCIVH